MIVRNRLTISIHLREQVGEGGKREEREEREEEEEEEEGEEEDEDEETPTYFILTFDPQMFRQLKNQLLEDCTTSYELD